MRKPGRDPRDKFVAAKWRDDVQEIADLKPGMQLEGVVTNVTRFGAFIDIGVHQDGLVHMSELANRYVKDASEVVKVGQIVKVQVLNADAEGEADRALDEGPGSTARPEAPKKQEVKKAEVKKPSLESQIASLSSKFKVRP